MYEWIGFALVIAVGSVMLSLVMSREMSPAFRKLLVIGFGLRIVGSLARYEVIFRVYGGLGDAVLYFHEGQIFAEQIRDLDFSFIDPSQRLWGTQFLRYTTGFVLALIGPTMRGGFLAFSLMAFFGLYLFVSAFQRAYPYLPASRYLAWLVLWPSLWFWPASIGKEAMMLLAIGLMVAGYVGKGESLRWSLLIPGLVLVTAIRPHVAGVTVVAMVVAHWLGLGKRMTGWGLVQALLLLGVALFVLNTALGQLGLEPSLEELQDFMDYYAGQTEQGGSNIGAPTTGWAQVPMAYINILLRPFPWEAHNPPALVASIELMVFWFVFYRRRERIVGALRCWRSDRFLRLALPLGLLYVAMIGLVFGNLGIIARQRVVVLPLILLLLEALPRDYVVRLIERRREAAARREALLPRPRLRPAAVAIGARRST